MMKNTVTTNYAPKFSPKYLQKCGAEYTGDGKLHIKAEALLPDEGYELVSWYEENPSQGEIKTFFEMRRPINGDDDTVRALPLKKCDLERELGYLQPGEYRRLSFYVEGRYYKTQVLDKPLKVE